MIVCVFVVVSVANPLVLVAGSSKVAVTSVGGGFSTFWSLILVTSCLLQN